MAYGLLNKYYIRKSVSDEWQDIAAKWNGVRVLSISGFGEMGDAVNVYNEQWINSQVEDFLVTLQETVGNVTRDVIIRKNTNLVMNIIVSRRYSNTAINEQDMYRTLASWIATIGDFYIRSVYTGEEAHVICLDSFKPTAQLLNRGNKSYIMASITLHTLEMPKKHTGGQTEYDNNLYIGFGGSTINASQINSLTNKQYYNVDNVEGEYTITCASNSYLWICSTQTVTEVTANGFNVPLADGYTEANIGTDTFKCYRSYNMIAPHIMTFTIETA